MKGYVEIKAHLWNQRSRVESAYRSQNPWSLRPERKVKRNSAAGALSSKPSSLLPPSALDGFFLFLNGCDKQNSSADHKRHPSN